MSISGLPYSLGYIPLWTHPKTGVFTVSIHHLGGLWTKIFFLEPHENVKGSLSLSVAYSKIRKLYQGKCSPKFQSHLRLPSSPRSWTSSSLLSCWLYITFKINFLKTFCLIFFLSFVRYWTKLYTLTLLEVEAGRMSIFTILVVNLCKFIPERLLAYPNYYFIDIIA